MKTIKNGVASEKSSKDQITIEDFATIESISNGVPVYSFNNITYVYGESPDFYPGVEMQENNKNPITKMKLKKSWEIKHNYAGAEHEMTVRTPWNDTQPLLPIHLIDGDPDTIWCSWGCLVPDGRPEWIRIDLPVESVISSVSLVCSKNYMGKGLNWGRALPEDIEIRVSRDAWHWETVYHDKIADAVKDVVIAAEKGVKDVFPVLYANKSCGGEAKSTDNNDTADSTDKLRVIFEKPVAAKQVWIVGNNFTTKMQFVDFGFSLCGVEVNDLDGNNLALISRGAGVTVSSTSYGILNDRYTQDTLWGPLQYDLGNKWIRMGVDNGSPLWCYTEHEKGKLEIDKRFDESITEAVRCGLNVILGLDYKGNWIYENPPRKTNWKEARFKELSDLYNDGSALSDSNPEMFEGYLRYVEYMVDHFKDRVTYFEVGNEWNCHYDVDQFLKRIFEPVYAVIKRIAPDARIMFGSTGGFPYPDNETVSCLGKGSYIEAGKFIAAGRTMLTANGINEKDLTVSVESRSEARVGIVLRFKNNINFLLAVYDRQGGAVYFNEVVNGTSFPELNIAVISGAESLDVKKIDPLGADVRLTAVVKGSTVTLDVTDGVNTGSASHEIRNISEGGSAGIMHCPWISQTLLLEGEFRNFTVKDMSGNTLFNDNFSDPSVKESKWSIHWNKWRDDNKLLVGPRVDAIGIHGGLPDKNCMDYIRAFKTDCEKMGFRGKYFATEIYAGSIYPPGPIEGNNIRYSEYQMAKDLTQSLILYSSLDMEAGPCHPHFTAFPHPQSLCRVTWPVQTINPCQPTPAYYTWRNVATALDDFYGAEFPVSFSDDCDIRHATFMSGDKKQLIVALWVAAELADTLTEKKTDVIITEKKVMQAYVIDIFNGTEQELNLTEADNDTIIKEMIIKDYPLLIRLSIKN